MTSPSWSSFVGTTPGTANNSASTPLGNGFHTCSPVTERLARSFVDEVTHRKFPDAEHSYK